MKSHHGLIGAVTSFGTVGLSFAHQLEAWLRISALGIGVIVSALTAVSVWRGIRISKLKEQAARAQLCRECQDDGNLICPYGVAPEYCPKKAKNE